MNLGERRLFSAYAEVFPQRFRDSWLWQVFSLPTQRCFLQRGGKYAGAGLFSAYAEVFPHLRPVQRHWMTFLCLRRGVSILPTRRTGGKSFSLPTQRCFHSSQRPRRKPELFSAYAEVFLADWSFGVDTKDFSLPTQRCFLRASRPKSFSVLFSAYAEVFLCLLRLMRSFPSFLCLRRGVSPRRPPAKRLKSFSLPTQRCFL